MNFGTISVIGLGYIGLPTAAIIASRGIDVIGVDVNKSVVNTINNGEIHIVEPELDILVRGTVTAGMLRSVQKPVPADVFIIAVPTPFKGDHEPDLSFVESSVKSLAQVLKKGDLIILESTCPVGTTEKMSRWLAEARSDLSFPHQTYEAADIQLAYCPERVLPGKVVKELVENDRIIGGLTERCAQRASLLYKLFVEGECVLTDARTAEMVKLTENSFRDVNIAFANELSIICDKLNVNVWNVIHFANRHPRVNILQPGPGVGGHCIAVDPWFIVAAAPDESRLISVARQVNDLKPNYVIEKVKTAAKKFKNAKIACLGLAFKADIDDLRESPSMEIVQRLKELKIGNLYVVEPHIDVLPESIKGEGVVFADAKEAIASADIVLLMVDHHVFNEISTSELENKELIDTRGLWKSL